MFSKPVSTVPNALLMFCCKSVYHKIKKKKKKANTNLLGYGRKMVFMVHLEVAGALVNQNSITKGS